MQGMRKIISQIVFQSWWRFVLELQKIREAPLQKMQKTLHRIGSNRWSLLLVSLEINSVLISFHLTFKLVILTLNIIKTNCHLFQLSPFHPRRMLVFTSPGTGRTIIPARFLFAPDFPRNYPHGFWERRNSGPLNNRSSLPGSMTTWKQITTPFLLIVRFLELSLCYVDLKNLNVHSDAWWTDELFWGCRQVLYWNKGFSWAKEYTWGIQAAAHRVQFYTLQAQWVYPDRLEFSQEKYNYHCRWTPDTFDQIHQGYP